MGDPSLNITTSNPDNSLDSGWPDYLAAAQAADPNFESIYGTRLLANDYGRLPEKISDRMHEITGHGSHELFRIGYMLLLVQERDTYTLDDLAHVLTSDWALPTGDLDLIDRVRDKMAPSCHFIDDITICGFRRFVKHLDKEDVVEDFMRRFGFVRGDQPEFPRRPGLSHTMVKVTLCAEIWCTWASRNRCPLPSRAAFVEVFGSGLVREITEFTRRLTKAFTCPEFENSALPWYGYDVALLRYFKALVFLVEGLQ
ncbi:hypothetical protein ANO14919_036860 [Xylariales sp. No.14919]|nr:hypothetical protein ANO14919_036860 [Xylariales sp. No.14919]